jgi:hypothetical protein
MSSSLTPSVTQWSRRTRGAATSRTISSRTFYDGMKHRPNSTFGTVNDDVLALKDMRFQRIDFCRVILNSAWAH